MDRRERILAGLPRGLGLEIGPGADPLAAGAPGLEVRTLDHLDQAGLIAKFSKSNADVSRIRPVDYVWTGQPYLDLVGEERFDWILASHVIEHVPDLIGFVNQCGEILRPGGVLSLAVPDRRYEFDYYRPPAGLGGVIDAHLQQRRLSSPGLAAEFALYMARLEGRDTWTGAPAMAPTLLDNQALAGRLLDRAATGDYVDIHAWVFTAHSFRLLIEDLHALGLLKLREAAFEETGAFEFYVRLSADGAGPGLTRQELCERALAEFRGETGGGAVEPLQAENRRLRAELEAHRTSTSWRMTAPLRALKRLAG